MSGGGLIGAAANLFGGKKAAPPPPKPAAPPPPPTVDDAKITADRNDLMRKRQGRSATFKSTPIGRTIGGVATKMLLGQGE